MHTTVLLVLLSAFAGAIHVLAPDHWVPASILSWRRRWRAPKTVMFSAAALTLHVLLGAGLYFVAADWLRAVDPAHLFPLAMAFVLGMMFLRGFRFSRIHDVQRIGPNSWWGPLAVVSILGPCESIIPIFIKSSSLGVGYVLPFVSFLGGTLLAGSVLILTGRLVWNRPFWLTRALDWVSQRVAALPVAAGVVLGLKYLLRLS